MADHTDNALRAAIKALNEVVGPAVDPSHPGAQQQLRLVVQFLEFHRERLPYHLDRARFELRQHLALAERLAGTVESALPQEADRLRARIAPARRVEGREWVRPADARDVTAALETAITAVVRAAADLDEERRRPIERMVVDAGAGLLTGERAWFAPQGFEPDPGALPPLEDALELQPEGSPT
jgi:hypothetical protein